MTYRPYLVCCLVLLLVPHGVQAGKPTQQGSDGAPLPEAHAGADDDTQRRRAALRTSVQTQQQSVAGAPPRKLSPQDREELRQQLRQQRREGER